MGERDRLTGIPQPGPNDSKEYFVAKISLT